MRIYMRIYMRLCYGLDVLHRRTRRYSCRFSELCSYDHLLCNVTCVYWWGRMKRTFLKEYTRYTNTTCYNGQRVSAIRLLAIQDWQNWADTNKKHERNTKDTTPPLNATLGGRPEGAIRGGNVFAEILTEIWWENWWYMQSHRSITTTQIQG